MRLITISINQLETAIQQKNGFPLDIDQANAISHGQGPLWIIAGPGTGKTEVLVVRTLKLICCDNINPKSIMITTFTQKAARNLEDRIAETMLYLINLFPQLQNKDISQLRIGTLHSLCNDILQEFRYIAYQNLRLLDEIECRMLIRDRVASAARSKQIQFLCTFHYLFRTNNPNPNLWDWTDALKNLFDRLIEDQIDINRMKAAGGAWAEAVMFYDMYLAELNKSMSCDFAHLQKHFSDFLNTSHGQVLINGDGTQQNPPLEYILVDEYQDSNPIQERIYFTLASGGMHNISVVGDDDQALYRFRGGTVESMVGFGQRCQIQWGVTPSIIALADNHRSNKEIVDWCNDFISSHPIMITPNARVAGKPPLNYKSGRSGIPATVGLLREKTVTALADSFAHTVKGMKDNNIIQDYSQCVLLLRSTKDTAQGAGPYIATAKQLGIPIYNPRARSFLEQPEVQQLFGAFISIIDPGVNGVNAKYFGDIHTLATNWVNEYIRIASTYTQLNAYVTKSRNDILTSYPLNERITSSVATIIYRIMSLEPFISYQQDPEQDLRLSKITRLFEAFCSQVQRELYMDKNKQGEVNNWWLSKFYTLFCGYFVDQGIDDDEDEEVVCPFGKLPIMTIHQSKGLEFDIVFVGNLGSSVSPGRSHYLENDLHQFRTVPPLIVNSPSDGAWQDELRLHFVAYSRSKHILVLMASDTQLRKRANETASFGGFGGQWIRNNILRL